MVLIKVVIDNINNNINDKYFSFEIKNYLKNNPQFTGLIVVDCYGKIHNANQQYIPQDFNNKIVYISSLSFQQNHLILGKQIRRYTYNLIRNFKNLLCIGGESYLYSYICNIPSYNITNNSNIYNDMKYNNSNPKFINKLVDYNDNMLYSYLPLYSNCLINLSKLNINLINILNNYKADNIIIISCHHDDFWKKIKLLTNYKLISRKKFICYKMKYFITVNILVKKQNIFVSLGHNCSISWNLKQLNLKKESYPFDWCEISLTKLIKVLSNNFLDYEKVEIVKLSPNHIDFDNPENKETYIIKNKYNIRFAHEVISKMGLEEFSNKLLERIERFKKLKNPIFIIINSFADCKTKYKDNYNMLKILLDKYFNKYKLKIIHNNLNCNNYIDWKYSHLNWRKIFNNLI
jgi:hypothetical protein